LFPVASAGKLVSFRATHTAKTVSCALSSHNANSQQNNPGKSCYFEHGSGTPRSTQLTQLIDGHGSRMLILFLYFSGGAVAQLGARLDGIEEVVGSNPIGSTSFP
jgi:hypothetical protein